MISPVSNWQQMRALARRARVTGMRRQNLELRLSPDESKALADVLDSALQMLSAVVGEQPWSLDEPNTTELAYLATEGGSFTWLAEEPELYSDDDLEERFDWAQE